MVIPFLIGLFRFFFVPRRFAKLPFSRSECSREDYDPVTVSLTEKEVKRCIEAIYWYLDSHAEEMERSGLDEEIARYEDLVYRIMSVPDSRGGYLEGRRKDRLS